MFRFSIRDVLWLTVVVGLAVGWWVEHRANFKTISRLRFIATNLTHHLNGQGNLEVKFENDNITLRTIGTQKPAPLKP
jgi:hypothetical protein